MVQKILRKNKKLIRFITILLSVFVLFLVLHNKSHNYEMEYNIKDISVIEKYEDSSKSYQFNIKYQDMETSVIAIANYSKSRHLIKDIDIINDDNSVCLNFITKDISLYSICHNNEGFYSPFLNKEAIFKENDTYGNIAIDDISNHTYLLWNYKEFIYLNNGKKSNIRLFGKDRYNLGLIYQYDNYLVIPDYDQEWLFDRLYILNANNGKVSNYELRFPVYFDSYFLGNVKNNVYIYDIKEEQEYYFDLKKEDINKTMNRINVNGNWENVTKQKLKNKAVTFVNDQVFDYYLKDNTLYAYGDIKVSNRKIDTIVKVDNLNVFYLSKGVLYMFNPLEGEKAIIKYSEWEFNSNNMIFVF